MIRKALLLAHGYTITPDHLREALASTRLTRPAAGQTLAAYVFSLLAAATRGEMQNVQTALVEAVERELYTQAIQLAQGNQAQAAKWLGVSRPTMREKLTQFGLRHPRSPGGAPPAHQPDSPCRNASS